ncbi:MAG: 3'-5' exonuclease [Christensenellaceae bacterium]
MGDDDQSIYAWRGADVRNILDFEKDFKNAQVIKLEQNYRSHQRILDAANAVIRLADARKEKNPWSARVDGPKPKVYLAPSEYAEAEFIAREITTCRARAKSMRTWPCCTGRIRRRACWRKSCACMASPTGYLAA